jgi:serine/threonine protein kinase
MHITAGDQSHLSDTRRGTHFYTSPETITQRQLHRASDVWSFGVILFELMHGSAVYVYTGRDSEAAPSFDWDPAFGQLELSVPLGYTLLVRACLEPDLQARPSFEQACSALRCLDASLMAGDIVDSAGILQVLLP